MCREGAWRRVAALAAIAALLAAPRPLAQQGVFRSGVEIVLVDVTVVDRAGQPVSDLAPSDFRVTVDGKPRAVASAQFLSHRMKLPARPKERAVAPAGREAAGAEPRTARDVLIVVDEDSMSAGTGLLARRAALRFLERLAPTDRAGVATIPRPRSSIVLTTERSEARKAVERIVAGNRDPAPIGHSIGVAEALAIERNDDSVIKKVADRECRGNYPAQIDRQCVEEVLAEAHRLAVQTNLRSQRSVDALRQLADGLRQVEGPKTMVLVSGGLPLPDETGALTRLAAALAQAQVTLYTVYVQTISGGADLARPSPSAFDDDRVESDGVENITSANGGVLLRAIGTLEPHFDRVAVEMSGSYLLGIEVAPGDRDGRPHSVDVSTGRRDVEVRARRQYVIPKPAPAAAGGVVPGPVDRAARARAERLSARSKEFEVTTPEVEAVVSRASEYVRRYEAEFSGLVAEEHYDQKLSKWKNRGVMAGREVAERGEWALEARRQLRSDYLLVKAPEVAGWIPFRDVFEVDGRKVRERDERLQKLFLSAPNSAAERANEILNESARYNIGYARNTNLPTLALMFLHPSYRDRFAYRKSGQQGGGGGTWEVEYRERAQPTLVQNNGLDLPAQGTLWIDTAQGRVSKTALRFGSDGSTVEITVTYGRHEKLGDTWIPTEMREVLTTPDTRLECVAQYVNFRRFQVTTDVQVPK